MSTELWTSSPFHEEVADWVGRRLEERGVRLTGERRQPHVRPWSSTICFGTTAGPVWFKANGPGTRHEAAVVSVLAAGVPDLVPEVLAADERRGWWLTGDAGPMLREALPLADQCAAWTELLPRYAQGQLALADERAQLLATGLPDLSPATLPAQARRLVESLAGVTVDAGGLDREQVRALDAWCRRLQDWCDELSSSGLPDSVQHDDLHSGNVCWTGSPATARVIDWGDASWGSPLGTLLVTLRALADAQGVPVQAAEVLRVRDAFLEPFTPYADRATLVRLATLACRAGCVTRASSWERALQGEPAAHAELGHPVRAWLLEALEVERE